MRHLLRPAITVTLITLCGQLTGFVSQVVVAAAFGAKMEMDAFLAASTLPLYAIAVLLGSIGLGFIPLFIEHRAKAGEEEAWKFASAVLNATLFFCGIVTVAGMLFAEPLIRWTTPGLSPEGLAVAGRMAAVIWPCVLINGVIMILTSLYQIEGLFSWQAMVPVIGLICNLLLIVLLLERFGIMALAIAMTANNLVQAVLLVPLAAFRRRYQMLRLWHPGLRQLLLLSAPLVVATLFSKITPLVDRYFASGFSAGSISHLGYAFKIQGMASVLISSAISTIILPKMALEHASGDREALKSTISHSLRFMWLAIAPAVVLGLVLARPLIVVIFQRGHFTPADAAEVAVLLQVYLLSMVGGCLGAITAKVFYALKATRLMSVVGIMETVVYVVYTGVLIRYFEVAGIAIGYVVYFSISLCWQLLWVRHATGNRGGGAIVISCVKTTVAAIAGALAALAGTASLSHPLSQLVAGAMLGLGVYVAVLLKLGSNEAKYLLQVICENFSAGKKAYRTS